MRSSVKLAMAGLAAAAVAVAGLVWLRADSSIRSTLPAIDAALVWSEGAQLVNPQSGTEPQIAGRTVVPESVAELPAATTDTTSALGHLRVHVLRAEDATPLHDVTILVGRSGAQPESRRSPLIGEEVIERSGRTGEDGIVEFDLPAGPMLSLSALTEHQGTWHRTTRWIQLKKDVAADAELRITTVPRRPWRGTVLDRDTGRPVSGATVSLEQGGEAVSTDVRGEFLLDGSSSRYGQLVHIDAPGYCPIRSQAVSSAAEGEFDMHFGRGEPARGTSRITHIDPTVIEPGRTHFLRRAAFIQGVLMDARDQPLTSTRVHVVANQGSQEEWFEVPELLTDGEGRFDFGRVPAGIQLEVGPTTSGAQPVSVNLAPGQHCHLVVRARAYVELSGRVLDERGEPVREGSLDASVEGRLDSAVIRSDGTYYLPFLGSGKGWVKVFVSAEEPIDHREYSCPIEIPAGVSEWSLDLRPPVLHALAGRFLDADGRPVDGGRVQLDCILFGTQELVQVATVCDAVGFFQFKDLPPGEYQLIGVQPETEARSLPTPVQADDEHVDLRLPALGSVRGRLTGVAGPDAEVCQVSVFGAGTGEVEAEIQSDGSFHASVPAGTVSVSARCKGLISPVAKCQVAAGGETIVPDLVLAPASSVRLVAGRAAETATFEFRRGSEVCASGPLRANADTIVDVLAGSLVLIVCAPGRAEESHAIEAPAGAQVWTRVLSDG